MRRMKGIKSAYDNKQKYWIITVKTWQYQKHISRLVQSSSLPNSISHLHPVILCCLQTDQHTPSSDNKLTALENTVSQPGCWEPHYIAMRKLHSCIGDSQRSLRGRCANRKTAENISGGTAETLRWGQSGYWVLKWWPVSLEVSWAAGTCFWSPQTIVSYIHTTRGNENLHILCGNVLNQNINGVLEQQNHHGASADAK